MVRRFERTREEEKETERRTLAEEESFQGRRREGPGLYQALSS